MASEAGVQGLYEYLRTAPARPIPFPAGAASKIALGSVGMLAGYSFREAAGTPAAATVRIFSGQDTSGILVAMITLAAGGFETEPLGDCDLLCEGGIFVNVLVGTVEGSVWARYEG